MTKRILNLRIALILTVLMATPILADGESEYVVSPGVSGIVETALNRAIDDDTMLQTGFSRSAVISASDEVKTAKDGKVVLPLIVIDHFSTTTSVSTAP